MREVSQIDYKWVLEIAPHFYEDNKVKILEAKHKNEIDNYDLLLGKATKKLKTNKGDEKIISKSKNTKFTISDMDYDV